MTAKGRVAFSAKAYGRVGVPLPHGDFAERVAPGRYAHPDGYEVERRDDGRLYRVDTGELVT